MADLADIFQAILPVVNTFNRLDIPYYIGGSVASSAFGMARSTLDADLIADIPSAAVDPLADTLKTEYYVSTDMIRSAIQDHSSFNVIHLSTMFKVDVFIPKETEYARESFKRCLSENLETSPENISLIFASPEDIILNKLEWYKSGNYVSDRQWQDALGVLRVQGNRLDKNYLEKWAARLGLNDLLDKLFREKGEDF